MPRKPLTLSEINELCIDDFVAIFGNAVENCSICAAAVFGYRPFRSFEEIQGQYTEFLNQLPSEGKAGVIRLYPDLAGKLAKSGGLTEESKREHASAGLDRITPEEAQTMADLNDRYKNKFDFPFVICVRENKKNAIIQGFEQRLKNDRTVEINNGINEVKKICTLRLRDLIADSAVSGAKL